jgi:hypothetical protein
MPDGLHPTPEAARAVIVPELLQLLGCRSDAANG